jgi:hypothetical protein
VTEPVGPEFGLEPRLSHELIIPRPLSEDLISDEDYRTGSEFGGVPGIIQPPPHVPTASERLHMIYAIDPSDPGTEDGSVVPPELDGNF